MTTCDRLKDVKWSGESNFYVCQCVSLINTLCYDEAPCRADQVPVFLHRYYPAGNVIGQFKENVQA